MRLPKDESAGLVLATADHWVLGQVGQNLNSLEELILGSIAGFIKGEILGVRLWLR